MPVDISPVQLETVDLDDQPLKIGIDEIEEAYALRLVTDTFYQYEQFRAQYHDTRWNISDTLYYGWLPAKTWEGTSIPRSCLGMPIVFDQIEAALPAIAQEIFVPQDEWFQVETEPGADIHEARQVQEHMSYVLEHSRNDYGLTARNELELAVKSTLLYGNGGIFIEYDSLLQRPVVEWVDTRDLYVDPGTPVPNLDVSRSVIRRKFLSVDELVRRRSDPRMKIPSDGVLYHFSKNPQFAVADQTKQNAEAIRGVPFTPNVTDYSPNPADRKIEVLIFYSTDRIIWILNRELVIYNEKNPYGFIPFCFAPCYIVPGRFYAQSMADVQEGNQRYIEALLNARLDAVSLEIQPPRVYKAGTLLTPAQLKWRPGLTAQMGDAKDMRLLQPQTQMANVFSEISFIKDAAEQRTGVSSMSSGIPKPSNTNRTATGVQALSSGTMSRLRELVSNFENYLIVPMLYKLYVIIQMHNRPGTILNGINNTGGLTQINSDAFKGKMRFRMLAASRMMTREKLANMFPFLVQYMLNGTFLGGLQKQGSTIDFMEMFKMLQDATGTGRLYNFIRDMNDQEKQALSQPPPEAQMAAQQKQQDLQTRQQLGQLKAQTDIQVAQISKQSDPNQQAMDSAQFQQEAQLNLAKMQAETQQDAQTHQMDMEREAARIHSEQMIAQIKAEAQRQQTQAQMVAKAQELQGRRAEMGMNLQAKQSEHALNVAQMQQQGAMDQQQAQQTHDQQMTQGQQVHEQMLENMRKQARVEAGTKAKKKAAVRTKSHGPSASD